MSRRGVIGLLIAVAIIIAIASAGIGDDCDAKCEFIKKETARIQSEQDRARALYEGGDVLTKDEAIRKVLEGRREYEESLVP
jgi:hypothetical protein